MQLVSRKRLNRGAPGDRAGFFSAFRFASFRPGFGHGGSMPFKGKLYLPFRLRLLLALIAAAGAGVYLTYAGIKHTAGPFLNEEAGERLLSRLNLSASYMEREVSSGIGKAELTAAQPGIREILARISSGAAQPGDRESLEKRLQDAAQSAPAISALELADARGTVAAAVPKGGSGRSLAGADLRRGLKGTYVSAPKGGRGPLEYDVILPVLMPAEKAGAAPLGVLRCRFRSAALPRGAAAEGDGSIVYLLARRQGNGLKVSGGTGEDREISLNSAEAAPFLPALEGKEGYTVLGEGAQRTIYAYRRLSAPDWLITAGIPYSQAALRGERMMEEAKVTAILIFALLAIAAVFAANLLIFPVTAAARSAAALLEDCGKPPQEPDSRPETELIDEAISEAAAMIRARTVHGTELESEAQRLREEETDLKYQNAELEKLNKYLSEREVKISELTKELLELKEKVGGGASEQP